MSDSNIVDFNKRLKKIEPNRQVRRKRRRMRIRLPWHGLLLVFLAVFAFKVTVILLDGEMAFKERLRVLEQEATLLYYPLKIFQPDPASRWAVWLIRKTI